MTFVSTRGGAAVSASRAILCGLAPDGGLYVPECLPALDPLSLAGLTYPCRVTRVLRLVLDDYSEAELMEDAEAAALRFDGYPAPVRVLAPGLYALELFHGPTLAFKDMALTLMPRLLTRAMQKQGEPLRAAVLVATSGDTGKAALEGFLDVPNTTITVFYPQNGVSRVQEMQMRTTTGHNTRVVAVLGNFDDAQRGVKCMLHAHDMQALMREDGFRMTSANSINLGRLVPQITYYFSAYADLYARNEISPGTRVHFAVPTGNFGNILALWYAKRMGLPVGKLICASNANDVLTELIQTGVYNANRPFHQTISPSMDILVSSNLERLLYALCVDEGQTPSQAALCVCGWMDSLARTGCFKLSEGVHAALQRDFYAYSASDDQTREEIRLTFDATGYMLDPHTAVASAALRDYRRSSGDNGQAVLVATASPFKFPREVLHAFGEDDTGMDDLHALKRLSEKSGVPVPKQASRVFTLPIRHHAVCDISAMADETLKAW